MHDSRDSSSSGRLSIKDLLIRFAAEHNLDSEEVVLGIADVLAIIAVHKDFEGGLGRVAFQERLHVFCGVAEECYRIRRKEHEIARLSSTRVQ